MPKYDFMSFGEPNIRLAPPMHDRFGQSDTLQLGIAAAELNCCVNISNMSVEKLLPTMKTAYITKLVDNWVGRYIVTHAQMYGVDMSNIVVEPFDRIGNTRNGLAFVEVGIGPRASYQIYDRGHTAVSKIQPGDINWAEVLDTRWFHVSGIVTALGDNILDEVRTALKTAKAKGATTSYDFNYRSTLWERDRALEAAESLMPYVDVLFGIDFGTDDAGAQLSSIDPEHYRATAEKALARWPHLKAVGTSLRRVRSALLNDWQGCLLTEKGFFVSHRYDNIEICDRVGSGDSFTSAIIWGFLKGLPEQEMVDYAAAYSALCHTVRNDWNLVTREEAYALMGGGNASVRR